MTLSEIKGGDFEVVDNSKIGVVFEGRAGADMIDGNERANRISGNGGNDILNGHGGTDVLAGNAGSDTSSSII